MSALEDCAMVMRDALVNEDKPRVALTLTTAKPNTPPATFRRDVEQLTKALRRRWPPSWST